MSIIEMEVHMDCNGCEGKIREALCNLQGVETIDIDMQKQKVTVSGYADQMTVLNAVRRTGKKAQFWPYPDNTHYQSYVSQYHYQQSSSLAASTYNYEAHAYNNETVHGYDQSELPSSSAIMDDRATSLFSDENPHACSVM
jgi:copper chaperone CopZ